MTTGTPEVTLLPCPNPWCEGPGHGGDYSPAPHLGLFGTHYIACTRCCMDGPKCQTEAEAIAAWNTRATTADLQAENAMLRNAIITIGRSVGAGLADTVSSEFLALVPGEVQARLEAAEGRIAGLEIALWLFREFTIRNATQWQMGANHHHPIYLMIAELVGEMGGITSGEYYRFVQPENREYLATRP